ncbi:hypothetical protein GJU40_19145 [Bacillus lacus]|uniref:Uncharacterized protein n=1 Tax=Metabacillus lacus TaxID=1983721 RepID=A0A7X2M155_9BACI|nr:hypothetical protein [Metabacillus lacus]MRX74242.1 hypothetical protein [Metabacillus lacus]
MYHQGILFKEPYSAEHLLDSFGVFTFLAGGALAGTVARMPMGQVKKGLKVDSGGQGSVETNVSVKPVSEQKFDVVEGNMSTKGKDGIRNARNYSINNIIEEHGLSINEFNALRLTEVSKLSSNQKERLKSIRNSVPTPNNKTVLQKVIPSRDIEKYMNGTYTQVGGYVTRADDVLQLKTYKDIYQSLRLDYPESVYNPLSNDTIGIIRYTTNEVSEITIPYGKSMGGTIEDAPPFTGNGFTKAENGQIIPEYKTNKFIEVSDGAQLIEIRDGKEILRAVYN